MRRHLALAVAVTLSMAACTSHGTGSSAPAATNTGTTASQVVNPNAQDADLILTMYADITEAFQRKPDDGVRAIIAAQYPGDSADVDFARCVNALAPGAKTLPSSKKLRFAPKIATMAAEPGYTVTSGRVKKLHPKGRIYVTEVTITEGTKQSVHERHQVILNGKAYQFSAC